MLKVSKITDQPEVIQMNQEGPFLLAESQENDYQFWTAQSQQNDQFENLYIFSHGEARNIKLGQQLNLIQAFPFDTPHQEVGTPLPQ